MQWNESQITILEPKCRDIWEFNLGTVSKFRFLLGGYERAHDNNF